MKYNITQKGLHFGLKSETPVELSKKKVAPDTYEVTVLCPGQRAIYMNSQEFRNVFKKV